MAHTLRLGIGVVDLVRGSVRRDDGEAVHLTTKEREVLAYLAAHPGQVIDRDTLLTEVWGHARPGVTRAVDHTVRRLRGKIERDPADPRHVLTEHGAGYRFVAGVAPIVSSGEPPSPGRGGGFVGRDAELAALGEAAAHARCVTVLGPGGVGKTRLVRRWMPDGAVFVDLSDVWDARDLGAAVAAQLGVAESNLLGALAAGERVVVLDNLEQVAVTVGPTLDAWLDAAPELTLVGTSRARLRVRGEHIVELGGLPVDDAVRLFVERARAVGGADLDHPATQASIARLTERLDGLPLAIELAAARAGILGPEDLLERLDDRFRVLGTNPSAHPRHRALDAAIAWSWEQLSAQDRRALVRCAVFRGGFHLDAAEAVIGPDALGRVQTLRDRSLLARLPGRPGRVRLTVLESIREFVVAADASEADAARAAHLRFFVSRAPTWRREARTSGAGWRRALAERANLLVAHERACDDCEPDAVLDLMDAVEPILAAQGPASTWTARVSMTEAAAPGARAVAFRARMDLARGQAEAASRVLEAALAPDTGDPRGSLIGLLGRARRGQRRYAEAAALLDEALGLASDDTTRAALEHQLGLVAFDQADWRTARVHLDRALSVREQLGQAADASTIRMHLGHLAVESGDGLEAERHYLAAASTFAEREDRRAEAVAHAHLALVAQERGDRDRAWSWTERALAAHIEVGDRRFEAFTRLVRASLATDAGDWPQARDEASVARRTLRELRDQRFEGVAAARLAVALAGLGQSEAAATNHAEAQAAVAGHEVLTRGVEVLGGFLDLARGDRDAAASRVASADAQRDSNFVRIASRQLGAALAAD